MDNNKFYEIQRQIRQNNMQLHEFTKDLNSFVSDIDTKDKAVSKNKDKNFNTDKLPPVRNRIDITDRLTEDQKIEAKLKKESEQNKKLQKDKKEAEFKRDTTKMKDYYKAWDNFNVDSGDSSEEEIVNGVIKAKNPKPDKPKELSQAEMMQRTSGARPNTKMVIKGGTVKNNSISEQMKAQGNSYFQSLDFNRAIDSYTQSLNHMKKSTDFDEMRVVVYSNRAQCHLKLKDYQNAFEDANKALLIDPSHIKSRQRRGTAAFYLTKLTIAKKDFQFVLTDQPNSKQFMDYLERTIIKMDKIKIESYQNLKRKATAYDLDSKQFILDATRIHIIELNKDEHRDSVLQDKKQEIIDKQGGASSSSNKRSTSQDSDITQDTNASSGQNTPEKKENTRIEDEDTKKKSSKEDKPKKNKKKKKNKKLSDFMDDDDEKKAYQDETNTEKQDQEEEEKPKVKEVQSILKSDDSQINTTQSTSIDESTATSDKKEEESPNTKEKKRKKSVFINLGENNVKEFSNQEPPKVISGMRLKDIKSAMNTDQNIKPNLKTQEMAESIKKQKARLNEKDIENLKNSESVNRAQMNSLQAPQNSYSFVRDFKTLKTNDNQLQYLELIDPSKVQDLFKQDLETDTMMDIVNAFKDADQEYFTQKAEFVSDFLKGIQSTSSFDIVSEFLMDDEKDAIKQLLTKIEDSGFKDGNAEVRKKFERVSKINE